MKIAFVIDRIYPVSMGGAEKRYWEIATRLGKKHEIHFFTSKNGGGSSLAVADSNREGRNPLIHYITDISSIYDSYGRRSIGPALRFSARIVPSLVSYKFDVIDSTLAPMIHVYPLKIVSRWTRSPLIYTVHEVWSDYWSKYFANRLIGSLAGFVERTAIRMADKIIAVSKTSAMRCIQLNVPKERIAIIPNGIDTKCINEIEPGSEKYHSDVIFVGRLVPYKGVDALLRAVRLLKVKFKKDLRVNIVGRGPLKQQLLSLIREFGLAPKVRLLDRVDDYQELIRYLKGSKLFVLPSVREGFSIATIEAMASGLPVITYDVESNAAREHVEDLVTGFKVKPNVDALASSVLNLLADPDLREKMSENAKSYGSGYDWAKVVSMLEKVYVNVSKRGA